MLSQPVAEEDAPAAPTESQQLLQKWSRLSENQQAAVFTLIDKM